MIELRGVRARTMRPRAILLSHRPGLLVTVTLLALALPAPGRAQPAAAGRPDNAEENTPRAHYQRGLNHYNVAEYDQAIAEFKKAYELSNAPELLFNIGQAYRLKGDCKQAVRVYRSFLREAGSRANRSAAESFIEVCGKQDASSVAGLPPAVPAPAGAPPASSPQVTTPPPVAPPTPAVAPAATASPASIVPAPPPSAAPSPVVADGPQAAAPVVPPPVVTFDAPRPPELSVPAPSYQAGRQKKLTGLIIASAGGAAIVGGVAFGLSARAAQNDVGAVTAGQGMPVTWNSSQSDREAAGKRAARVASVLLGVGAAAVVGGGVLYYLGYREAAPARITAMPMPGGLLVAWGGQL
jgi:hypothetical protein